MDLSDGRDSLKDLPAWHDPQRLLAACTSLGVLRRPDSQLDVDTLVRQLPELAAKLEWIEAPQLDISSSRIRQLVREGGAYRYYLPPAVYAIVQKHKLYT